MNIDNLLNSGIEYYEGVKRFSGKATSYVKCLNMFFNNNDMENLRKYINDGNKHEAYLIALDLKGTSGNLSINDFYIAMGNIVNELKSEKSHEDINELYNKAKKIYDKAKSAVIDS